MNKILYVLIVIITMIAIVGIGARTLNTSMDVFASTAQQEKDRYNSLIPACRDWLATGAMTKTYHDSIYEESYKLRSKAKQDDLLCPVNRNTLDSSELFDCRIMCVLIVKSEKNCKKDPFFYNYVFDDMSVEKVGSESGEFAYEVQVSMCESRIMQIITDLSKTGTPSTKYLYDCFVEGSDADECRYWKGKEAV